MIVSTSRFGTVEISDDKIITFPEGILGFESIKEYFLVDHSTESPLRWLQAVQEPDLAFVVLDPMLVHPEYQVAVHGSDMEQLKAADVKELVILSILTIPPGQPEQMTANLKGPLVINVENRLAKQVVLYDTAYPTRYPAYECLTRGPMPSTEAEVTGART